MATYYWYIKERPNEAPIGMLSFTNYENYRNFVDVWEENVRFERRQYAEKYAVEFETFTDYLMWALAIACESMGTPFKGVWDFRKTNNRSLYIEEV